MKFVPFYKHLLATCVLVSFSSMAVSADENCTSIVDLACDTEDLSTLCELISGSEPTAEALSTATFTVFAPTNEAFYNIDAELFDELVNCTEALNSVLAFHTVPGVELYSTDLTCTERTTMGNGDDSRTVCRDGKVFQKGSLNTKEAMPEIVAADIEACNGVVHVVDEVMIPKAKAIAICDGDVAVDTYEGPRNPGAPPTKDECSSIADIACADEKFTVLCDLVVEFELVEELSGGTWTVFAPTDEAFLAIEDVIPDLTVAQIGEVVKFHAIPERAVMFEDLPCKELTVMANGDTSRTKCDEKDTVKYQKGYGQIEGMLPKIITADIEACNGIVHVVDNVMIPRIG